MIIPIVRKKKIIGSAVDTATGEIHVDVSSINYVDKDLVIVHSDEYVIIDSNALAYIVKVLISGTQKILIECFMIQNNF